VIEMFGVPIFNDPVDVFLFDYFVDPVLPFTGTPVPLPVRIAAFAVELQYEAGAAIAAGEVAGKSQYTGQAAQLERAQSLGMNLIYQPGGIVV
jgi:hypothetical protein